MCGSPAIFHNPKAANRHTYQVCCARSPIHLDLRDRQSSQSVIDSWNRVAALPTTMASHMG